MKLTVKTSELKKGLRTVISMFSHRKEYDSSGLDCMLSAAGNECFIESSGYGIYASTKVNADVDIPGKVVLRSKNLVGLMLSGPKTTLSFENGKFYFLSGKMSGRLEVSQDFDSIESSRPVEDVETYHEIPSVYLTTGARLTVFLSGSKGGFSSRSNVRFSIKDGILSLTSADNFRGIIYKDTIKDIEGKKLPPNESDFNVVLPPESFHSLANALSDSPSIKLGSDGNSLRLVSDTLEVVYPIKICDVPDIEAYIYGLDQSARKMSVDFKQENMISALRSANSIVSGAEGLESKVEIVPSKSKSEMNIIARSNSGEATSSFSVKGEKGNDSIWMNFVSLQELLNLLGGGPAKLEAWNELVVIRSKVRPFHVMIASTTTREN